MKTKFLTAGLVLATAAGAFAATPADKNVDVVAELQALKAEVARMRAESGDTWLNQRRAEEVKALVHEVLADADTRASLAGEGMTAGYNKHFFLASEDGKFLLELSGQMQFRYIASLEQQSAFGSGAGDDDEDEGFQVRRTKLAFGGHVEAGRKWDYEVVLAADRSEGSVYVEDVWFGTQLADGLYLKGGLFKLPFLRGELTSSKRLLGVERGSVTEVFTLDRSEQIQVQWQPMDAVKLMASISDGANSGHSDIGADNVEFAFTARADVKLAGEWGQMDDYSAWEGEPFAAFVGAAIHYQIGDDGAGNDDADTEDDGDFLAWTVDGSVETNGLGVSAAVFGQHSDYDDDFGPNYDAYGINVQAAYQVIPNKLEPFITFEWMTVDTDDSFSDDLDDVMLLSFGANYYFQKHNAKVTFDVVWWLDGEMPSTSDRIGADGTSSGIGFASGDPHSALNEDAILLRAQFQLLF
jgi:hypothetical protein